MVQDGVVDTYFFDISGLFALALAVAVLADLIPAVGTLDWDI